MKRWAPESFIVIKEVIYPHKLLVFLWDNVTFIVDLNGLVDDPDFGTFLSADCFCSFVSFPPVFIFTVSVQKEIKSKSKLLKN